MTQEIPVADTVTAFNALEETLMKIQEHELKTLRFPASESTARALWMEENAIRDIALFEEVYKDPPLEEIHGLKQAALAIKGAEFLASPEKKVTPPDIDRAKFLRKKHLTILPAIFFNNEELIDKVKDIHKGRGYLNLGSDLVDMASLESNNWDLIKESGLINNDEIEELDDIGQQILKWVGQKKTDDSKLRADEQRAWTHMYRIYNRIRDYARIIYLDNLDKWERDYPFLTAFNKSTNSPKSSKEPDQPPTIPSE